MVFLATVVSTSSPTDMRASTAFILGLALVAGSLPDARAQNRELGGSGELLDGVAALVDTGIVLRSEFQNRMRIVAENFIQAQMQLPPEQRSDLPPLSILEQQVLEQLILEEIQVQRANAIGISIGDNDLNLYLAEIANSVGTTLEQLPAWLASEGVEYASFREDQRRDLAIRALERAEVVNRVLINDRELQRCLAISRETETDEFDYNISHILIGFSPDGDADEIADAEDRARDIVRRLDEGADFAQLALTYSESSTNLEGGLLGWRKGAELPTVFAEDVVSLSVGEHSTPIRGTSGFHIVRLNDMRGTEPAIVDQIRARHILLQTTAVLDDEATRQRLIGVRDQIVGGDEFDAVAAVVSDDTESAVAGGDLDWRETDEYVPEFAEVLESLEIGELSEPFQTRYGWHIAEVTGRRTYDMTEDLRESYCRNQIGNGMAIEELELWRRRIRDEAYVQKRL